MRVTTLHDILEDMPTEVQAAIKPVDKQTMNVDENGLETTSDKLFLLSEYEVFNTTGYSNGFKEGVVQYEYYAAGNSIVKTYNGSSYKWWLRSISCLNTTNFCYVRNENYPNSSYADSLMGISFAFCF